MITIQRPINGISLNGNECLLNDDNSLKTFETYLDAVIFCQSVDIDTDLIVNDNQRKIID